MNNNYIAHIIRDIFPIHSAVMYYGIDKDLVNTLNTSQHGIAPIALHSSEDIEYSLENFIYWNVENIKLHIGNDFFDFFLCVNYHPDISDNDLISLGAEVKRVMKKNSLLLVINCDKISKSFNQLFAKRKDIVKDLKRYSMLKEENVLVYENI